MEYTVVKGFHDVVENKGYRSGEEFIVGKKTKEERFHFLVTYGFITLPVVEDVIELDDDVKGDEVEPDGLDDLELDALKEAADKLEITYGNNIGKEKLIERIREFKEGK